MSGFFSVQLTQIGKPFALISLLALSPMLSVSWYKRSSPCFVYRELTR